MGRKGKGIQTPDSRPGEGRKSKWESNSKYIYQISLSESSLQDEYQSSKYLNKHYLSIYEAEQLHLFDSNLCNPSQLAFKASLQSTNERKPNPKEDFRNKIKFHPLFDQFINPTVSMTLSCSCVQSISRNIPDFDIDSLRMVLQASTENTIETFSLCCCYYDSLRNDTIKYLALSEPIYIHIGPSITMSGLENLFTASRCANNWRPPSVPESWEHFDYTSLDLGAYSSLSSVKSISLIGCTLPLFTSMNRISSELPGLTSLLLHQVNFYNDFKLQTFQEGNNECSIGTMLLDMLIRPIGMLVLLETLEISSCDWIDFITLDEWFCNLSRELNKYPENSSSIWIESSGSTDGANICKTKSRLKSIKLRGVIKKDISNSTSSGYMSMGTSAISTQATRKEIRMLIQKFKSIGVELELL